jgi:hypothetical protein
MTFKTVMMTYETSLSEVEIACVLDAATTVSVSWMLLQLAAKVAARLLQSLCGLQK